MSSSIPYYSAEQVHAALDYPALVEKLRQAFASGASVPLRHAHRVNEHQNARLLLMPAWREGEALGVKIVTAFPGNATLGVATVAATYVLLDGSTGHPRALIDGEALTLRRTAAASALASSFLSRPDSRTLLVIGTGKLAPCMAAAHAAVRQFARVLVWGRAADKAGALAARLVEQGLSAEPATELRRALSEADIVTCATTAVLPIVRGADVRPGTHVDLVGGFTPSMREADDELVAKASVFVDTYLGALAEGGDVVAPIAAGALARSDVRAELAELCRGEKAGRTSAEEITLFKSVGTALEDLAAAQMVRRWYAEKGAE
jgi:ornithine cyclodeaminase/alanine dehydrogenase-like protein (mu-crystallin family)